MVPPAAEGGLFALSSGNPGEQGSTVLGMTEGTAGKSELPIPSRILVDWQRWVELTSCRGALTF